MAIGNNETGIEYNPVDPSLVIAGSNGPGGQSMNWSNDGGVTWFSGGVLPNSCCDPASDWSSDGTIAYTATLGSVGGGGWRTVVYRSTNFGQSWSSPVTVSSGSSDKEYIHVDKSASSPYQDNVYATWHQSNTMFFARSTDLGVTFQTPISFPSAARGIGSDITTDAQGRIYYAWPSTSNHPTSAIWVVTSNDGGATFSAPVQAYDLRGEFDFAIPSMESRRAFIYISADTDQSGGPNHGRVYLAFTDEAPNSPGNGNGSAANSHGWVQVIYSDDQGATWQVAATPHSTADQATVDRYHPWLDVDDNGVVHIGFYDTRNSTNRTGVDFYYVYSADGGASWTDETRVSQIVSQNITNGQEWGDYNGLSVSRANVVGMSWTDNRIPSGGSSPQQKSFVGRVTNIAGGPSYQLAVNAGGLSVCAGQPVAPIPFTARAFGGFSDPVMLSFPGINASVFPTSTATPNPVTPAEPATAGTISLSTAPAAPAGTYDITLFGTNGGGTPTERSVEFEVTVASGIPGSATLTAPANGASGVATQPVFTWTGSPAAVTYTIELASDAGFGTIIATDTVEAATWTPAAALSPNTQYFWRVRANSPCGDSAWSATFSFTTGVTFPEPYCEWDVTNDVEPITLVNYAGINNRSSAVVNGSPSHEDFTGIIGNVAAGSSAQMAVEGNTAGDFNTLVTAFIDWNRDGDFSDAGETYQIGNIDNSTGEDGQQAINTIAVPPSVTDGPTRLRVVKKYNTAAGPCNTDGWGQAEDYTLMVGSGGATYTVGGSVSGLTGSGLALSLNGAENLPLAANGVFTFATELSDGASYAVTVATQPAGETCVVANGSGTISGADVTNVAVTCTTETVDLIFADGFDGEVVAVCEPLQLLQDTSFEASLTGGPWTSTSTNFGTGLC
ncbi:MAG TPA: GEVED domain-containing protein, partial [Dokdonella sp.]